MKDLRDPAWRQQEPPDTEEAEEFVPPERDLEYEAWLDDHDRRFSDRYDTANGDIGDGGEPPY